MDNTKAHVMFYVTKSTKPTVGTVKKLFHYTYHIGIYIYYEYTIKSN